MSLAIAPLGAEFVVSERRNIAKGEQYLLKFPAIRNPGFGFDSSLVAANLALGLVGKKPFFSVFAEAQNLSALSQRLAGQVVQSIALECARRQSSEACLTQAPRKAASVVNAELDFYFHRGRRTSDLGLQASAF
jgi:hypothetical protein